MSRISIPSAEHTVEASKPLLAAVHKSLGITPNLMKVESGGSQPRRP